MLKINNFERKFINNISCVYGIKNEISGKIYIGSTKNLYERLLDHKERLRKGIHFNQYLQHSWNKNGEVNFSFYILEKCIEDLLIIKEQYWMDFLKSHKLKNGYNIIPRADRKKISAETKKKISDTLKKKYASGELKPTPYVLLSKKGKDSPTYGRHLNDAQKKKISDILKNKHKNGEITIWSKGKKFSKEHCKKISEVQKGRVPWNKGVPMRQDLKENLIKHNIGRKQTEEEKNKRAQSIKNYWANATEEQKNKKSESTRKRFKNKEDREKHSKIMKECWANKSIEERKRHNEIMKNSWKKRKKKL